MFPALVGMNRRSNFARFLVDMFPALVGMNRRISTDDNSGTMFPALVGMNRTKRQHLLVPPHVPRTRGDEPPDQYGR